MTSPALVVGRFLDVLAWNPLAGALLGEFTAAAPGRAEPAGTAAAPGGRPGLPGAGGHRRRADRDAARRRSPPIRGTRARCELVGELAVRSDEFATLWARHDVEETTRGRMRVDHPLVGELNLDWDAYPMPGAPGPVLIVYTAEEGSPDDERLQLLAGLLDVPAAPATTRSG